MRSDRERLRDILQAIDIKTEVKQWVQTELGWLKIRLIW